ncbi:hypothetical protein V9T40_008602 [Parthenolecanium corni]|uniref:Uncharacterized protein n=1 Tax=Parthenolecanium corni TaxID=536013 RepID=A0AAN9Y6R3_9HEMI
MPGVIRTISFYFHLGQHLLYYAFFLPGWVSMGRLNRSFKDHNPFFSSSCSSDGPCSTSSDPHLFTVPIDAITTLPAAQINKSIDD